ncbi:MAG: Uncharacterised protein [Pseudidiomarina mangrovi]|nr:MAG: Uncharacterised protein [Pseudidiomarina mangrovi]
MVGAEVPRRLSAGTSVATTHSCSPSLSLKPITSPAAVLITTLPSPMAGLAKISPRTLVDHTKLPSATLSMNRKPRSVPNTRCSLLLVRPPLMRKLSAAEANQPLLRPNWSRISTCHTGAPVARLNALTRPSRSAAITKSPLTVGRKREKWRSMPLPTSASQTT